MRCKSFFCITLYLLLIAAFDLKAQGIMDFVNYPGSVSTSGMGEEGAALKNSQDAFTYNPANLSYSEDAKFSFFRNPFQSFADFPLSNVTASLKFKGIGSFGLQYLRHEYGDIPVTTVENPDASKTFHMYKYALALGYAREFSEQFSLGLSLKYGHEENGYIRYNALLLSVGINYQPEIFNKRLNLGFSLMNMGSTVKPETDYSSIRYPSTGAQRPAGYYVLDTPEDPVSSMMHLALRAVPLENDYLSANVQVGISRYLYGAEINGLAKSSFSSLFDDWKNFPMDTKIHTGLAFEWKPLDLGNDFSFYQNFYLGSISSGPKTYSFDYYTHGAEIGIGYKDAVISLGYSGRWHNIQGFGSYIWQKLPWETFQFSFGWNLNKYLDKTYESKPKAGLSNVIITAGAGYNFRKGNMLPNPSTIYEEYKSRNSMSYQIDAAFYLNGRNALVTGFYYTSIPIGYVSTYPSPSGSRRWEYNTNFETVGIYSDYRYHPLEYFSSLYLQGGLGIVRINPIGNTTPRYLYQTSFNAAVGTNLITVFNDLVITPELGYQLMLWPINISEAPRLGGESQLTLSVRLGYRF